jgi:hypothetical protein
MQSISRPWRHMNFQVIFRIQLQLFIYIYTCTHTHTHTHAHIKVGCMYKISSCLILSKSTEETQASMKVTNICVRTRWIFKKPGHVERPYLGRQLWLRSKLTASGSQKPNNWLSYQKISSFQCSSCPNWLQRE